LVYILPVATIITLFGFGCAQHKTRAPVGPIAETTAMDPNQETTVSKPDPGMTVSELSYDTTATKPVSPRDWKERQVLERKSELGLVDRIMDPRTPLPPFDRQTPASSPRDLEISDGVEQLPDVDPFAEIPPLSALDVTINVGIGRSTYRTREPEEVMSAVQPFIDLVQREVNIRGDAFLYERPNELYFDMLDGKIQMAVCNVFEYLMVRDWFAGQQDNGAVLLATARPARPWTTAMDGELPGTPGTSIELIVAADSVYQKPEDLRGKRLAMPANVVPGPGTFLTRLLSDLGHPKDQPYFSKVTLRRYSKDAVIDVLKGAADAACVDQGTVGAVCRFYGIEGRIRTVAVSPRYNVDVLFTSVNNVAVRREEIELTQRQLTTLGKDPEGQEVLFFFDVEGWSNYREGDIDGPRAHYEDYVKFIQETPADLLPLLDPNAPVERKTYDRFGDE